MTKIRIGIDIMGGDYAPSASIQGSILAMQALNEVELVLIGDETLINEELKKHEIDAQSFSIVHATDNIEMGEHPTKALLKKPNSSIAWS